MAVVVVVMRFWGEGSSDVRLGSPGDDDGFSVGEFLVTSVGVVVSRSILGEVISSSMDVVASPCMSVVVAVAVVVVAMVVSCLAV